MGAAGTASQTDFRGRNDDGTEVTATWKAAQNANWSQPVDQNARIRFNTNVGGGSLTLVAQLQYRLTPIATGTPGSWTTVSTSSSVVKSVSSPFVTDATATTEQLNGAGTYIPGGGEISTDGRAASSMVSFQDIEHEYPYQIVGADVADGDTVELRLVNDATPYTTYTSTPAMTISKPATRSSIGWKFILGLTILVLL